jgi:hypothetical protein
LTHSNAHSSVRSHACSIAATAIVNAIEPVLGDSEETYRRRAI